MCRPVADQFFLDDRDVNQQEVRPSPAVRVVFFLKLKLTNSIFTTVIAVFTNLIFKIKS